MRGCPRSYAEAARYRDLLKELDTQSKRAAALAAEWDTSSSGAGGGGAAGPKLRLGQRVTHAELGYRCGNTAAGCGLACVLRGGRAQAAAGTAGDARGAGVQVRQQGSWVWVSVCVKGRRDSSCG